MLERYSDSIIDYATNPISGIQRKTDYPPTIKQIATHCDDEVERLAKLKRYREMAPSQQQLPRPPQHRGNVYVPPNNALFPKMVEAAKHGTALDSRHDERGGIWVPLGWIDDVKTKKAPRRLTVDDLRNLNPDRATVEQFAENANNYDAMPDGRPEPPPNPFEDAA